MNNYSGYTKEEYERRQRKHQCVNCSRPAAFLSIRCTACLESQARSNKQRFGIRRVAALQKRRHMMSWNRRGK